MSKELTCDICGDVVDDRRKLHNAAPVINGGRCCIACNASVVAARVAARCDDNETPCVICAGEIERYRIGSASCIACEASLESRTSVIVHSIAFTRPPEPGDGASHVRIVRVPNDELPSLCDDVAGFLEAVFRWGQNDVQPMPIPSVSMGDVVELSNGELWQVGPIGFKQIDRATFESECQLGYVGVSKLIKEGILNEEEVQEASS